jgi:hypothetical protein
MRTWESLSPAERRAYAHLRHEKRQEKLERESADLRARVGGFAPLTGLDHVAAMPKPRLSQAEEMRRQAIVEWKERHRKNAWDWIEEAPESLSVKPCGECDTLRPEDAKGPCPVCRRDVYAVDRTVTESYSKTHSLNLSFFRIVPDQDATPETLGYVEPDNDRWGDGSHGGLNADRERKDRRAFQTLDEDREKSDARDVKTNMEHQARFAATSEGKAFAAAEAAKKLEAKRAADREKSRRYRERKKR